MISRVRRLVLLAVLPAVLAAACGSGSKATSTTTTKDPSGPSAQSGHYHAGERCPKGQSFAYLAQGFTCVNGTLRHKTHNASPATVHHHSNTSTSGTHGYLPGY
jgi:hypothetical protein